MRLACPTIGTDMKNLNALTQIKFSCFIYHFNTEKILLFVVSTRMKKKIYPEKFEYLRLKFFMRYKLRLFSSRLQSELDIFYDSINWLGKTYWAFFLMLDWLIKLPQKMAEVDKVIKRKFVYWPTSNIGLVYHMFEIRKQTSFSNIALQPICLTNDLSSKLLWSRVLGNQRWIEIFSESLFSCTCIFTRFFVYNTNWSFRFSDLWDFPRLWGAFKFECSLKK